MDKVAVINFKNLLRYGDGLRLQVWLAEQVKAKRFPNCSIFCQHTPTFTAGRRLAQAGSKIEADLESIKKINAEYYQIPRGGQLTFHGPGQLVGYPILRLQEFSAFKHSVRCYVESLQNALVNVCRKGYSIDANLTENTGVWVNDNKIAALGIHVQHGVTTHGFALNCNTDLQYYKHIVPCGLVNKGVTSLSAELQHIVTPHDALPKVIRELESSFSCQLRPLTTAEQDILHSFFNTELKKELVLEYI